MTLYDALAHIRNSLQGSQLTAEMLGREPGQYVPVRRDALELLLSEPVRPMGVIEAERQRNERAETSGTVGVDPSSTTENGAESAPAPTSGRPHDPTCGYPAETFAPSCWCEQRKQPASEPADILPPDDSDYPF